MIKLWVELLNEQIYYFGVHHLEPDLIFLKDFYKINEIEVPPGSQNIGPWVKLAGLLSLRKGLFGLAGYLPCLSKTTVTAPFVIGQSKSKQESCVL